MHLLSLVSAVLCIASSAIAIPSALVSPNPSPVLRRDDYDCPFFPFVEFHNNCPKGTTLAVYRGYSYAFTLNSNKDNARQSVVHREEYENYQYWYAMINQGAYGGPEPDFKNGLWADFFLGNYWFVKPKSVKNFIPVRITPDIYDGGKPCPSIICDSKSCIADEDHPDGRRRKRSDVGPGTPGSQRTATSEEDSPIAALEVYGMCPDVFKFIVTYCPEGKL